MNALRALADRFPRLKAVAKGVLAPLRAGATPRDYVEMQSYEVVTESRRLRGAWQDVSIPSRQRDLVEKQLAAFRRREAVDNFDVMQASLRDLSLLAGPASLLEVGCSSGYYSEVIARVSPGFAYSGCDYSPAFIEMARRLYPDLSFEVEDATALHYDDDSFDVVVSGCCLLHIPDYRAAVAETARVARTHVIFHRTPVVIGQPEKIYRKRAYGVETIEIHFNEPEFIALVQSNGLELIATHTLTETIAKGKGRAVRTYVCRKVAA
jgi:SAM-dependent methyltransferase